MLRSRTDGHETADSLSYIFLFHLCHRRVDHTAQCFQNTPPSYLYTVQQQSCISFICGGLLGTTTCFPCQLRVPKLTVRCVCFLSLGAVAARWFQPAGLRPGLSAAHLPTHREDRKAAGSQPPAAEADLQLAEEQQDDQDQRGARSFLPLLTVLFCGRCPLGSKQRHAPAAQGGHRPQRPSPSSIEGAKRQNQC